MGQRAFRGRLTDSIIKNYIQPEQQGEDDPAAQYFKGKPLNMTLEFDLCNPLHNIDISSINLTRGLINLNTPKNCRINTLNLKINSDLFGLNKSYLHSNLYILFGSYFLKDINNIAIKLYNPVTEKFHKDRKIIRNVLEFMCFKTIKLINVNTNMLFYVIPEYSDFCIVLAYRDMSYTSENSLEELFHHPYCSFSANADNFMQCVRAIDKTIPKLIKNIILPTICFDCNLYDQPKNIFGEFKYFMYEVRERFDIMSVEIKIKLAINQSLTKILSIFVDSMLELLQNFEYSVISFNFESLNSHFIENAPRNDEIAQIFKNIIKTYSLHNVTFAHHTSYSLVNLSNQLEDEYDYYDYVYYDKRMEEDITKLLMTSKISPELSKLYKRKGILRGMIENMVGEVPKGLFKEGRFNYSSQFVKNFKIVPLEISRANTMIFAN